MDKDLKPFLSETYYCNCNHPDIQDVANRFKIKYKDKKKLAIALFYYVRDHTTYRVGKWQRRASETLAEEEGTCTNNTNLLVALLRAVEIPAGYGVMVVQGQEYFGPVVPKILKKYISEESRHIYCFVYLNNKWIRCDPSDDELFSLNTQHFNPQSRLVEWDGVHDAILNLDSTHIIADEGPISNIDFIILKKAKRAKGIPLKLANLYIRFLRINGNKIAKIEDAETAFVWWMTTRYPLHFFFYWVLYVHHVLNYSTTLLIKNAQKNIQ